MRDIMISDPRKFVRAWLTKNNVTIDERGGLQAIDGRDTIEIFKTLYLDYCEQFTCFNYKTDKKVKREGKDILLDALEELVSLHVSEERKKIFNSIRYQGEWTFGTHPPLVKFITAVTGNAEPHVVAVLAHYIWTIKRRMLGKETFYQMMPIIFGGQNA